MRKKQNRLYLILKIINYLKEVYKVQVHKIKNQKINLTFLRCFQFKMFFKIKKKIKNKYFKIL
jgi:hypothetical protein